MSHITKSFSCVLALSLALSACQSEEKSSPKPVKAAEVVEAVMPLTLEGAMLATAEGASFTIIMDQCPESDEGYEPGMPDFLGTVKCGERYSGTYDLSSGQYTVTGLNEGTGNEYSATFEGPDPRQNVISIWGGIYAIDENFNAKGKIAGEFVNVGTFKLSE